MKNQRGVVYLETLIGFMPAFLFFLATLHVADASVASLVMGHAAEAAARAAVVVLPDDGAYYGDPDNGSVHQNRDQRATEVEHAADIVLSANRNLDSAGANVSLDSQNYAPSQASGDRQLLTARVTSSYRCLIALFCPGGMSMKAEAQLIYQGARYQYEPASGWLTSAITRRATGPKRQRPKRPDTGQNTATGQDHDGADNPPLHESEPIAQNDRGGRRNPPGGDQPGDRSNDNGSGSNRGDDKGSAADRGNGNANRGDDNGSGSSRGDDKGSAADRGNGNAANRGSATGSGSSRGDGNGSAADRGNGNANRGNENGSGSNRGDDKGSAANRGNGNAANRGNETGSGANRGNGNPTNRGDGTPTNRGDGNVDPKSPTDRGNPRDPSDSATADNTKPGTTKPTDPSGTNKPRDPIAQNDGTKDPAGQSKPSKPTDPSGSKPPRDNGEIATGPNQKPGSDSMQTSSPRPPLPPGGAVDRGNRDLLPVIQPSACFIAGTLILTPHGAVPIDTIHVGEHVYAYDNEHAAVTISRVERAFERQTKALVDLTVLYAETGVSEQVTGTPEHPFYLPLLGTYVRMGELEEGDMLLTASGDAATIYNVSARSESTRVFNFEVEALHNYFVAASGSEQAGLLVHNASCNDPGGRGVWNYEGSQEKLTPAERRELHNLESRAPKTEAELQRLIDLRKKAGEPQSADPEAGTPEHMMEAWHEYQASGRTKTFAQWQPLYRSAMNAKRTGDEAEARYAEALRRLLEKKYPGQNVDEALHAQLAVDVHYTDPRTGEPAVRSRRSDVVSAGGYGEPHVEIKAGTGTLNRDDRTRAETAADTELVKAGTPVTWVIESTPSAPLVADLVDGKIDVIIRGPKDAALEARITKEIASRTRERNPSMTDAQVAAVVKDKMRNVKFIDGDETTILGEIF